MVEPEHALLLHVLRRPMMLERQAEDRPDGPEDADHHERDMGQGPDGRDQHPERDQQWPVRWRRQVHRLVRATGALGGRNTGGSRAAGAVLLPPERVAAVDRW